MCKHWMISGMGLFLLGTTAIWAQDTSPQQREKPAIKDDVPARQQQALQGSPLSWNIESVMEIWVRGMTRHYNLNEKQEDFTRRLLTQRAKKILKDNEKDVRLLLSEYLDYQSKKELPSASDAEDFARRAKPLIETIRKEVFEGNELWRNILDDEQKAKHDKDLEGLQQQFKQAGEAMDRWAKGDVRESDFMGSAANRTSWTKRKPEDNWEFYVRKFIADYKLTDEQQQTAASILRQFREEAQRYREAHKDELATIDAKSKELTQAEPAKDADARKEAQKKFAELNEQRRKLDRPITVDMFNQLKSKLDTIPTEDQKKAHAEWLSKHAVSTRPSRSSSGPSSRPDGREHRQRIRSLRRPSSQP